MGEESGMGFLNGTLFYTVPAERAVEMVEVSINTDHYREAVKYRYRENIDPRILNATSLSEASPSGEFAKRNALITGTGRSGTTYLW